MDSIKDLEATVLVQGCLLRALAWKQVSAEPLGRLFTQNYSALSKEINGREPRDEDLLTELKKCYQALSASLPRNA